MVSATRLGISEARVYGLYAERVHRVTVSGNHFSVSFRHSAIAFPSQSLRLVFQAFEVFVHVLTYDGSL